jgi:hypothetical protein
MSQRNIRLLFAAAALTMGLPAYADIYTFNIDHCSGGCGTGQGTVTVTAGGANTVEIAVQAAGTGFEFVNSTSHGDDFLFNISGSPTISVSNVTAGWKPVSLTAGSYGGGGWSFEYAMTCDYSGGACDGNGGSKPAAPPLDFDVMATGLTTASFQVAGGGTTADFAADALSAGNTGLIGATLTSTPGQNLSPVPEPGSIILLCTMLVGIVTMLRKGKGRSCKELG